ncbi:MAG TPA: hypothetical protein VNK95_24775 [Caldilineaceae bacterium]|nr:hypothetical protein [Caldilineaceae bacterium]
MNILRSAVIALIVSILLFSGSTSDTSAVEIPFVDDFAYNTEFVTAFTYYNAGTSNTTVAFNFYNGRASTPIVITRSLNAGAGGSLYVGSLGPTGLSPSFRGAVTITSNQPILSTLVHVPSSTSVKARAIANATRGGSSRIIFASVLKNYYGLTSIFSVQNASSSNADFRVSIYNANDPSTPIVINTLNVPPGAAAYYDMGALSEIMAGAFTGSAIVEGRVSGTPCAHSLCKTIRPSAPGRYHIGPCGTRSVS